ncbi:MAG: iron chelate uptake ABC transporter family permease subunit, partial [Candidatus Methanomethylophilaceae archaeon]|nr:iron chelate uptake ABC transporter family permease subunit [Candidatus Methanomethylophilaceae archaeon]
MKQKSGDRQYDYRDSARRKYILICAGVAVCLTVLFVDVVMSARYINPLDVLRTIFNPAGATNVMRVVVWDIKIPSSLMGIVVGLGFGISGAVMQTILNNPLASPYTLGISAGAGFGAAFAMVMGVGGLAIIGGYLIPLFAFVFAMGACAGIFIIAKLK